MNMPWWFRLYTKHSLVFLLKLTLCLLIIHYIFYSIGGMFVRLSGILIIVPMMSMIVRKETGAFRHNLEFHKMNIPFPQLKKSLLLDIYTILTATLIVTLLNLYIAIQVIGTSEFNFEVIAITPMQGLYFLCLYYVSSSWSLITAREDRKYKLLDKHPKYIVNLMILLFYVVVTFSLGLVLFWAGYRFHMFLTFGFASVFCAFFLFHSKAIFHKYKPVGTFFDSIKFFGKGFAICLSIYFVCMSIGRNEVFETKLSNAQRSSSFEFSGPFAPQIDSETFVAIDKYIHPENRRNFYSKADFPVASLGLTYFLDDDPYSERLKFMLFYTKPDEAFLTSLYDDFEARPEYWKGKRNLVAFKEKVYSMWPTKNLPAKYLVAKNANQKAKRDLASKKTP